MRYVKESGWEIPRDVAIAGFDDIEMSTQVQPRLTTVRVFKEEMGKAAVRRLLDLIRSKSRDVVTIHVPVELIPRESSESLRTSPVGAATAVHD
jgi:LacI family transcriptional regulator